jgi:hypothetical protein
MTADTPWLPDDGHQWHEHTPGDPMPVEGDVLVEVLTEVERDRQSIRSEPRPADFWQWGDDNDPANIVAWRHADV